MSSDAEERRERAAKIHKAIEEYMADYHIDGIAGDWVLIGAAMTVDDEGDPDCQYFIAMKDGTLLQHVALGLLLKAKEVLADQVEGDD